MLWLVMLMLVELLALLRLGQHTGGLTGASVGSDRLVLSRPLSRASHLGLERVDTVDILLATSSAPGVLLRAFEFSAAWIGHT